MKCLDCGYEAKSSLGLARHVTIVHGDSEEYYLRHNPAGFCLTCGSSEVSYIGMNRGYKKSCSHECAGILHRKTLASDSDKNDAFRKKFLI